MTIYITPYDVNTKKPTAESQPVGGKNAGLQEVAYMLGLKSSKTYRRMLLSMPDLFGQAICITFIPIRIDKK